MTSSTAFSLSRSENLKALISACASDNSLSLSANTTQHKRVTISQQGEAKSGQKLARSSRIFAPLTSFSNRLSSTLTGSEPCNRFMNSSASRLCLIEGARLRDEPFPSLNDPDTANGATGVATVASVPTSPETSAMADLSDAVSSHIHLFVAPWIPRRAVRETARVAEKMQV